MVWLCLPDSGTPYSVRKLKGQGKRRDTKPSLVRHSISVVLEGRREREMRRDITLYFPPGERPNGHGSHRFLRSLLGQEQLCIMGKEESQSRRSATLILQHAISVTLTGKIVWEMKRHNPPPSTFCQANFQMVSLIHAISTQTWTALHNGKRRQSESSFDRYFTLSVQQFNALLLTIEYTKGRDITFCHCPSRWSCFRTSTRVRITSFF